MNVFNRCENSNDVLLAIPGWANVHPLLKVIPVEWEHSIPYGILHAPKPAGFMQPPFDGVPRALAMNAYMPVFTALGNLDGGRFPIYSVRDREGNPFTEEMVEGINSWARVNHAREIDLKDRQMYACLCFSPAFRCHKFSFE